MSTEVNATLPYFLEVTCGCKIAFDGVGFFIFLGGTFLMLSIFIVNYKKMVSNKKLLYSIVLAAFILEQIFQITGFITCSVILLEIDMIYVVSAISLEQTIFYLSIAVCVNCQCFITKILKQLYFNKSHEWVRTSSRTRNIGKFITGLSISLIVIVNLLYVAIIPFIISSNVFKIYDTSRNLMSEEIYLVFKQVCQTVFAIYISITSIVTVYYSILNISIVVLLIRKLILNQKFPITEQRKKSCRNLLLLTFGQLYMSIFNLISLILGAAAFGLYIQLYPVCLLFHKIALLSFCIFVTFSFGPLDNLMIEMKSNSNIVETIKRDEKSQVAAAMNHTGVEIIRKEDFREDSFKYEIVSQSPSLKNETPIRLIDPMNEFTEIPLYETSV